MITAQQRMYNADRYLRGGALRCYNLCHTLNYSLKLLCLLLILGTFFLPAFRVTADATNASGTLGVCNIEDPTYDISLKNIDTIRQKLFLV